MLEFMTNSFWGVRLWIWFYLLFSMTSFLFVMLYFFREKIKKFYYSMRYPEKLFKVVMHFKGSMYKEYWRILPDNKIINFKNKKYFFDGETFIKDKEMLFCPKNKSDKLITTIENKEFTFNEYYGIKRRWNKYPEIHYFYNNPNPIKFEISDKQKLITPELKISSNQLSMFKENDLFSKLLLLKGQDNLIKIIMIIAIANVIGTTFILLWLLDIIPKG